MIELPESHVIAGQMREALSGKRILKVEADHSPHKFTFYQGDPATYPLLLEGLEVSGARPVGGMVELLLGDMRMTFGDGVKFPAASGHGETAHEVSITDRIFRPHLAGLLGADVWRDACVSEGRAGESLLPNCPAKADPYAEAFNCAYFGSLLSELKPSASVKAFLATEQRIPGLGNGVLQDILFQARIHPKSKVFLLCDAELEQALPQRERNALRHAGRRREGYGTGSIRS